MYAVCGEDDDIGTKEAYDEMTQEKDRTTPGDISDMDDITTNSLTEEIETSATDFATTTDMTVSCPDNQILCIPIPLRFGKWCKKECHCERGYFRDKTNGKCVEDCPPRYKSPTVGVEVDI
ncbi:hypothetical protein GWI33_014681 [Rhynchophorus ferrugineus]|uniref:TIL domain-containing protein n=1 Tax=Rhynchophorus ferrugineus TaxID=354439 RepID=A0A834MC37_RHYFE|nr:hypothetical protein GWI33_014681 [Rhynchophorus ferrugineus]